MNAKSITNKFRARSFTVSGILLLAASCSLPSPSCEPDAIGDVVYVVGQGGHSEIGLPVKELSGGLEFYRGVFSGARVVMFGYGKKTFFTAPPKTLSEYVLGPFPGTAAIQAVGLLVAPPDAYPPENTIMLQLPPGGAKALSAYIWNDLAKDDLGKPQVLSRSHDPEGLFYAAQSEYTILHTCNSWVIDGLRQAGVPASGGLVAFSGQVMDRVARVAEIQCKN